MRILAVLCVFLITALSIPGIIATAEEKPGFDKVTFGATGESVVRILSTHMKDGRKVGSMGTGTVIDGGILTAWHVVDDAEEVTVSGWNAEAYVAKDWVRLGDLYDVALIRFEKPLPYPALSVAGTPSSRQRVRSVGFFGPLFATGRPALVFGDLTRDEATEAMLAREFNTQMLYCVHAPAAPGMSGSPILLGHGKIVGVISRGSPAMGIFAAGIDLEALKAAKTAKPRLNIRIRISTVMVPTPVPAPAK